MRRRLLNPALILFTACLTLFAQVPATYGSLPDITGTGSVAKVSASNIYASWVQLVAPSTNASNVVCCDASISSSRGAYITPGQTWFLPFTGQPHNLSLVYTLVQSGDVLKVTYQLAQMTNTP